MDRHLRARLPRYVRIAEDLRDRLTTSSDGSPSQLPSETKLAEKFNVSRETLRRGLALLREEGLVYSVTGRGTFVSPGSKPIGVRITHPIREPYVAGRPSKPTVLSQGFVSAPRRVAQALGIPATSTVYLYEILRTIKERPFRLCRVYLPGDVARKLDLGMRLRLTVSEKLESEGGLRLIRAHQEIVADRIPEDAARILKLPPGSPALHFRRTYYQDMGRAVEYVEEYQNSRAFPFEETLVRSPR